MKLFSGVAWPGAWLMLKSSTKLGRGRLQNPNGPVQSIFKMYPTIRFHHNGRRLGYQDAEQRSACQREIGTWKRFDQPSIGGQRWRNHLTRILRGLIRDVPPIIAAGAAPRLNHARRIGLCRGAHADVNDWVKAAPDDIDWLTGFTPADANWEV